MRHTALVLAAVLLLTIPAYAKEPKVGALHPELRLPTIDGEQTISLRSLQGKRVLLLQFASW